MTVDTKKYRATIETRRRQLGGDRYADANRADLFNTTKVKVSAPDLEELLEAYDRLQGLLK